MNQMGNHFVFSTIIAKIFIDYYVPAWILDVGDTKINRKFLLLCNF